MQLNRHWLLHSSIKDSLWIRSVCITSKYRFFKTLSLLQTASGLSLTFTRTASSVGPSSSMPLSVTSVTVTGLHSPVCIVFGTASLRSVDFRIFVGFLYFLSSIWAAAVWKTFISSSSLSLSIPLRRVTLATLAPKEGFGRFSMFSSSGVPAVAITTCVPSGCPR
jgi:hypothetical protein